MNLAEPQLRLAFVRGTAPNKWARRWRETHPDSPLDLIALEVSSVAEPERIIAHDVLLERVQPGNRPADTTGSLPTRHAVRLYSESVALVVAADHELAESSEVDRETLALVSLLEHPDHADPWPSAEPLDETWRPRNAAQALEFIATGSSGLLLPLPLARQLTSRNQHAVITVIDPTPLAETEIWASWAIARDGDDIQQLIGVLRGRTSRSSRGVELSSGKPADGASASGDGSSGTSASSEKTRPGRGGTPKGSSRATPSGVSRGKGKSRGASADPRRKSSQGKTRKKRRRA